MLAREAFLRKFEAYEPRATDEEDERALSKLASLAYQAAEIFTTEAELRAEVDAEFDAEESKRAEKKLASRSIPKHVNGSAGKVEPAAVASDA